MSDFERTFTEAGNCTDEVKLHFEDGQTLHVSQNMLAYASPVFKAMFENDFREKNEREVKLVGKHYKDVLEFLLCLHPAVQKRIGPNNILQVVGLAEEYQVGLLINRCKFLLPKCLDVELEIASKKSINDRTLRKHAFRCLAILHKALECRYTDIVDYAVTIVSRFGYGVFSGTLKLHKSGFSVDNVNHYRNFSLPSRDNYIQYDNEEEGGERHEDDAAEEENNEGEGEGDNEGGENNEGEGDNEGGENNEGGEGNDEGEEENNEGEDTKEREWVLECRTLFSKLPDDIKYKLLVERLKACDKNTML